MKNIPLAAIPQQFFSTVIGGQNCQISIMQRNTGVFFSLSINSIPIASNVICLDRVRLVRGAYLGFIGNLVFLDTQGKTDPAYAGFGTRYVLAYLEAGEK